MTSLIDHPATHPYPKQIQLNNRIATAISIGGVLSKVIAVTTTAQLPVSAHIKAIWTKYAIRGERNRPPCSPRLRPAQMLKTTDMTLR